MTEYFFFFQIFAQSPKYQNKPYANLGMCLSLPCALFLFSYGLLCRGSGVLMAQSSSETWLPKSHWLFFNLAWSKYKLEDTKYALDSGWVATHCELTWQVGIPTIFLRPLPVFCTATMPVKLHATRAIPGDCEIVYSTIKFLQAAVANTDCLLLKQGESFKNTDNGFVAWQPS